MVLGNSCERVFIDQWGYDLQFKNHFVRVKPVELELGASESGHAFSIVSQFKNETSCLHVCKYVHVECSCMCYLFSSNPFE